MFVPLPTVIELPPPAAPDEPLLPSSLAFDLALDTSGHYDDPNTTGFGEVLEDASANITVQVKRRNRNLNSVSDIVAVYCII